MDLNSPTKITWIIAVILGVLGILGKFIHIQTVSGLSFWLVAIAFILLALGSVIKGL
jgi:hypothetical protein